MKRKASTAFPRQASTRQIGLATATSDFATNGATRVHKRHPDSRYKHVHDNAHRPAKLSRLDPKPDATEVSAQENRPISTELASSLIKPLEEKEHSPQNPDSGYCSPDVSNPRKNESDAFEEAFEEAWEALDEQKRIVRQERIRKKEKEQARLEEERKRNYLKHINYVYNWTTGKYDVEKWDPDWSEEE